MKEVTKVYSEVINWFSLEVKQQQDEVQPALPRIKTNHSPRKTAKELAATWTLTDLIFENAITGVHSA